MSRTARSMTTLVVSGLLGAGLLGLLGVYAAVVSELPSTVYTPGQYAYLNASRARMINQVSPVWNVYQSDTWVQLESSALPEWQKETRVRTVLDARFEEQDGVSVTVYDLDFHAEYRLSYPGPEPTLVELYFPFPGNLDTLREVTFLVDGVEPEGVRYALDGIRWQTELEAGQEHTVAIGYQAEGANSFTYALNRDRRSDVLDVSIVVRGLEGSRVVADSLPATGTSAEDGGETFTWRYTRLIPSRDIRLDLPARLGFAQRVAQLQDDFRILSGMAPFLVSLFLAALFGLFHLAGVRLPLPGYLLMGCAVALFYPLLTFLSGVVSVLPAAGAAFTLVAALTMVFPGLTGGWRRTGWRVGLLLVIFLGFFSLGMLSRWRGLLLTGGGLLLVGTLMLAYARRATPVEPAPSDPLAVPAGPGTVPVASAEVLQLASDASGVSSIVSDNASDAADTASDTVLQVVGPTPVDPALPRRHCPRCGRALAEDFGFCPGCGFDVHAFRRCGVCGHEQFVPAELQPVYCFNCGESIGC